MCCWYYSCPVFALDGRHLSGCEWKNQSAAATGGEPLRRQGHQHAESRTRTGNGGFLSVIELIYWSCKPLIHTAARASFYPHNRSVEENQAPKLCFLLFKSVIWFRIAEKTIPHHFRWTTSQQFGHIQKKFLEKLCPNLWLVVCILIRKPQKVSPEIDWHFFKFNNSCDCWAAVPSYWGLHQ